MVFIKDKAALIHYWKVKTESTVYIIFQTFQVHLHLTLIHNNEIILQLVFKLYLNICACIFESTVQFNDN